MSAPLPPPPRDDDAPTFSDRLDAFQRRHPVVGFPLGVVYKFLDDQGAYLAALITYYALLSIFPMLLILASVLGFLVQDNERLREQVLDGVLAQLPVIADELAQPSGLQGSIPAVVFGGLIALYGAIGVAQALQHAMNTIWSVPRHSRPNPVKARFKSAGIIMLLVLGLVGAGGLPKVLTWLDGWYWTPVNMVLAAGLFWILLHLTTARTVPWRTMLPGAFVIGLMWQVLETVGGTVVNSVVARSGGTYGVFAVVIGLILWLFVLAASIVVAAEINVVWARHLYPRALLTVFTDDVDLTQADHDAYSYLINANRLKGYQEVSVMFDKNRDGLPDPPSDWRQRQAAEERRRQRKAERARREKRRRRRESSRRPEQEAPVKEGSRDVERDVERGPEMGSERDAERPHRV